MWRIWVGLAVLGIIVLVYGFNEARVGFGASSKPQEVNLAELEGGKGFDNNHVRVGKHVALFTETIYEYSVSKHGSQQITPSTTVNFAYYPIISLEHPYIRKQDEIVEKYGSPEKVPDKEWPAVGDFAVLVKTSAFRTVGKIPQMDMPMDKVQGLVINRIKTLEGQELSLLRDSFPKMNFDKVLILEAGRKPSSTTFALAAMLAGLIITAAAVGTPLYLAKSKRDEERRAAERQRARMAQAKANVRQAVASGAVPGSARSAEQTVEAPPEAKPAPGAAAAQQTFRPGQIRRRRPS